MLLSTSIFAWWWSQSLQLLANFLTVWTTASIFKSRSRCLFLISFNLKFLDYVKIALSGTFSELDAIRPNRLKILMCNDKVWFFRTSQYIFLYLSSSSFFFFLTCPFYNNIASRVIPSNLAVFEYGIRLLLSPVYFSICKIDRFCLIYFHLYIQSQIQLTAVCRFWWLFYC